MAEYMRHLGSVDRRLLGLDPLYVICVDGSYFEVDPDSYEPLHTTRFGVPEGARRMALGEWQLIRARQREDEMSLRERAARETAEAVARKCWDEPLLRALNAPVSEDEAQALRAVELERIRGRA